MGDPYRVRLVAQADLTPEDDVRISGLLTAAFPEHPGEFVDASYRGARPDHRLWLEDPNEALVAHLGLVRRVIAVGDADVLVAEVSDVAVAPDRQGRGLGRRLNEALFETLLGPIPVPFGYAVCRPAAAGFFESVGWTRVAADALVLPATAPITAWPPGPLHRDQ